MSQIVMCLALAAGVAAAKPADAAAVRGRVLDPDGRPVAGARLYSLRFPKAELKSEEDIQSSQRAKSDAEGRFRFELPRSGVLAEGPLAVLAAADGYGMDWIELAKDGSHTELILRLVKDHPIEGRILSTEGKPLAGVRVRALTASKAPVGKRDDFLAAWKQNGQMAAIGSQKPPAAMLLPPDEKGSQAVTDKDGRFRLRGTGAERLVLLKLHGPGITPAALFVLNRAGFDAAPKRRQSPPLRLYGPMIEYVALAGRSIEGTIREIGSGKPVAGFRIHTSVSSSAFADSDKDGRYKLEGIPKMGQYLLMAWPPEKSSWLQMSALASDVAGAQPLRVDFTVARGVVVSGRVIDKTTGKGVPSVVRFAALPGNKFFEKPGHAVYRRQRLGVQTDADGSFRLAVFPGPGVLMASAAVVEKISGQELSPYKLAEFDAKDRQRVKVAPEANGIRSFTTVDHTAEALDAANAVKLLDRTTDADAAKCNLFVDRGATRIIRIEDADGKPLMGTIVAGVTAMPGLTIPIKDAIGLVVALDPKKPRRLLFLHVQRNLAGTLTLRGDEKEPVIVRLRRAATVTGRVLDANGKPLAGADVNPIGSDVAGFSLYRVAPRPPVRTDKDGRFRIEGIVPEVKFTLGITRGRTIFTAEPPIGIKQVQAGATLDLGDVRIKSSLTR